MEEEILLDREIQWRFLSKMTESNNSESALEDLTSSMDEVYEIKDICGGLVDPITHQIRNEIDPDAAKRFLTYAHEHDLPEDSTLPAMEDRLKKLVIASARILRSKSDEIADGLSIKMLNFIGTQQYFRSFGYEKGTPYTHSEVRELLREKISRGSNSDLGKTLFLVYDAVKTFG
jgi:hypothetical protein